MRQLDLEHLLSMTGGDVTLAEEVLDIFREQTDTWGRLLDPALSAQEWADAAHTLKGAALSLGAHEFAEQCAQTEALGRSGEATKDEAALALAKLKSGLADTLEACAWASHALSKPGLRRSNTSNS